MLITEVLDHGDSDWLLEVWQLFPSGDFIANNSDAPVPVIGGLVWVPERMDPS